MYFFKKIRLGFYVAFLIKKNIKIWLVTEQNEKVLGHYFCLILTSGLGLGARNCGRKRRVKSCRLLFLCRSRFFELLRAPKRGGGVKGGVVPPPRRDRSWVGRRRKGKLAELPSVTGRTELEGGEVLGRRRGGSSGAAVN